ncbi:hypothetical protein Y032_0685g1520 [Ancylostoma ceylanicum]|uniref:Uncharacterized protein n=1 Tax=Ancylostoma ceylanicum TaxID=53326 RepID=A0A016WH25_9BILA|nr:hypothetical protein Y032_0685g1520 [Ancylostoma ceylanicum]
MSYATRIRLHLSNVETLNASVLHSPRLLCTNLPTPERWMAWLARSAIEPSTVCVRNGPLTTAPHAPCLSY